jgi:aspartate kinase
VTIKVCKFGGSSVADASQLEKVREIVAADPARRIVVPSAPGKRGPDDVKVTDQLYRCRELAAAGEDLSEAWQWTEARYRSIIEALGLGLDLGPELAEVREHIEAGASADYVASRGEYLNGHIVAALLDFEFVDPASFIVFDADRRFDADSTQQRIEERLDSDRGIVVPGFYGADPSGEIVTFSRGGSDITGAILARGVGAALYENWTDVPGVLMTDPRIVDEPRPIEIMTYQELRELAYMGATVLHEDAVFPVRASGIPVNIRDTNDPDHPGTLIVPNDRAGEAKAGRITGIAGRKDFSIIAVEKTLMNAAVGFGMRMLGVLERRGIPFEHMPSGIDTMSLVLKDSMVGDQLQAVAEEIREVCEVDSLEIYRDIALIATVGRGMSHFPGMAARLFTALYEADVNVRMIDQGSSELNIIVGVDAADFEDAVRAIYAAFVHEEA